jgi:hypothetical protein
MLHLADGDAELSSLLQAASAAPGAPAQLQAAARAFVAATAPLELNFVVSAAG